MSLLRIKTLKSSLNYSLYWEGYCMNTKVITSSVKVRTQQIVKGKSTSMHGDTCLFLLNEVICFSSYFNKCIEIFEFSFQRSEAAGRVGSENVRFWNQTIWSLKWQSRRHRYASYHLPSTWRGIDKYGLLAHLLLRELLMFQTGFAYFHGCQKQQVTPIRPRWRCAWCSAVDMNVNMTFLQRATWLQLIAAAQAGLHFCLTSAPVNIASRASCCPRLLPCSASQAGPRATHKLLLLRHVQSDLTSAGSRGHFGHYRSFVC